MPNNQCTYLQNAIAILPSGGSKNIRVTSCCRIQQADHINRDVEQSSKIQHLLDYNTQNSASRNYEQLKNTECIKCYKEEQHWKVDCASLRLRSRDWFIPTKPAELNHLDISFSNFCNHACRYCGPNESTLWLQDFDQAQVHGDDLSSIDPKEQWDYKTGISNTINAEKRILEMVKSTDVSKLQSIYIKGGEPFITRVLDDFFDHIIAGGNASNIKLLFSTNGSVFPKKSTLDRLLKFKSIELRISFDAVGELGEYIRHGMDWQKLCDNIKAWQLIDKQHTTIIDLYAYATMNIYCINTMIEFQTWCQSQGLKIKGGRVFGQTFDYRTVLPTKYVETLYNRYQVLEPGELKHIIVTDLESELENHSYNPVELEKFKKITELLDKFRNQQFQLVNPELHSWLYA